MAERSAESIALTILTITQVPSFWSGFLPSLYEVGGSEENCDEKCYWTRRAEINALGLSITLGVGTSIVAKSWLPLTGAVLMSAYLLYQYEHALGKSGPVEQRDDN